MSPVDFEIWLNHFEYHAQHPRCVPHGLSDLLRPDERRLIASSIATFQLGEQSEGRALLRAAQRFAHGRRIPALVRIAELLIREEQRHAALLGHEGEIAIRAWAGNPPDPSTQASGAA